MNHRSLGGARCFAVGSRPRATVGALGGVMGVRTRPARARPGEDRFRRGDRGTLRGSTIRAPNGSPARMPGLRSFGSVRADRFPRDARRAAPDDAPVDRKPLALSERTFHLLMGGLLFLSLVFDRVMRGVLPVWNAPQVGLLSLVLGLVWVGLFAAYRTRLLDDEIRILRDRAERAERKINALEDVVRRMNS